MINASRFRHVSVILLFIALGLILAGRLLYLQVVNLEFLQAQGDARLLRTVETTAHRGRLLDRNGHVIAASTPVASLWFNPRYFAPTPAQTKALLSALSIDAQTLADKLAHAQQREFVYLQRQISPEVSHAILALDIPGLYSRSEYRRFYPTGSTLTHLLGFTDVDDHGQEGLELALEDRLQGKSGYNQVIQDRQGRIIADVALLTLPQAGQDVRLSVDREIAYFTRQALRDGVRTAQAKGGAAVVLDARSGEVLAAVSLPDYNPNRRSQRQGSGLRNRVITDVFEPGSTLKPFTIAAALESGRFTLDSVIDTAPGILRIDRFTIRDGHNLGRLQLAQIIQKSSNIGAAKLALAIEPRQLWETLAYAGFGDAPGSGFPGESAGNLPHYSEWARSTQAALGYGYGVNVSLLQLARAYACLANHGKLPPIRLLALDSSTRQRPQQPAHLYPPVMEADSAWHVLQMLENVLSDQGTAPLARVPNYRVGGKTGTVHKAQAGGYAENRYAALFIGLAPLPEPRLVVGVFVDEPAREDYYGGKVAAPIFARIMEHALRLRNIPP